jgi:hypothetical protein
MRTDGLAGVRPRTAGQENDGQHDSFGEGQISAQHRFAFIEGETNSIYATPTGRPVTTVTAESVRQTEGERTAGCISCRRR